MRWKVSKCGNEAMGHNGHEACAILKGQVASGNGSKPCVFLGLLVCYVDGKNELAAKQLYKPVCIAFVAGTNYQFDFGIEKRWQLSVFFCTRICRRSTCLSVASLNTLQKASLATIFCLRL